MEELSEYWSLFAFIASLFLGGIGIAVGLTLWIMGQLSRQDAQRVEMKEVILKEIRERYHYLQGGIDQRYSTLDGKTDKLKESMHEMSNRLTRVETTISEAMKNRLDRRS